MDQFDTVNALILFVGHCSVILTYLEHYKVVSHHTMEMVQFDIADDLILFIG